MLVLFKMNLQDVTLFEWFASAFSSGLEGQISKKKYHSTEVDATIGWS